MLYQIKLPAQLGTASSLYQEKIQQAIWTKVIYLREGDEIAVADLSVGAVKFVKIKKITQLPPEQVYDIEVENTHNFVANGIIAHNTYISATTTLAGASGFVGIATSTRYGSEILTVYGGIYGSGNVIFLGTLAAATTTITGDVLPAGTVTYNLGSATAKWANIYAATTTIGNTIVIGGEAISATGTLAISAGSSHALNLTAGAASTWKTTSGDLTIQSAGTFTATSSATSTISTAAGPILLLPTTYVGIGTTSPASLLSVYGTSTFMGGDVGIGTTAPTALLDVYASSTATALNVTQRGTGNLAQFSGGTGLATTTVTIDYLGRVGIATSSPARMLEVLDVSNPQVRITQSGSQYAEFQIGATGDLTLTMSGNDLTIPDDNLWLCGGGSCPDFMSIGAGTGNLVVEKNLYVGDSTTDYMKFYANSSAGAIEYHGTARPKRTIILTASGGITPTNNGAAQTKVDGTNQSYYVLEYDKDNDEAAYWQWIMPDSYDDGTIDVTYYWTAVSATTTVVRWCFQATSSTPNASDSVDPTLGSASCATSSALGTANYLATATTTGATSNFVKSEYVVFRVFRDADNSGDTLGADARLVEVKIEYSVSQETD